MATFEPGQQLPEHEVVVRSTVREVTPDGRAIVETSAEQAGNLIIRNAEAELDAS